MLMICPTLICNKQYLHIITMNHKWITSIFLCKPVVNKIHGSCGSCSFILKTKNKTKFCSCTLYIHKNRICKEKRSKYAKINGNKSLQSWDHLSHARLLDRVWVYLHKALINSASLSCVLLLNLQKILTTPPWWQPATYTHFPVLLLQWKPPPSASRRKMAQA